MPYTAKTLAARIDALEVRVDTIEKNMPDRSYIEGEFKFLREQGRLVGLTLEAVLATLKLIEDRG